MVTAQRIPTEVGLNLSALLSQGHSVSWLRLAPRIAVSGASHCPARGAGWAPTGSRPRCG